MVEVMAVKTLKSPIYVGIILHLVIGFDLPYIQGKLFLKLYIICLTYLHQLWMLVGNHNIWVKPEYLSNCVKVKAEAVK